MQTFLDRISLPNHFAGWFVEEIGKSDDDTRKAQEETIFNFEMQIANIKRQISNLTDLRIRELLTDDEFNEKRQTLDFNLGKAEENLAKAKKAEFTFEPILILEKLCDRAIVWYERADDLMKQKLLNILCSNPSLKDKIALFEPRKPFVELHQIMTFLDLRGDRDNVRTKDQLRARLRKLATDPETIELANETKAIISLLDSPGLDLANFDQFRK